METFYRNTSGSDAGHLEHYCTCVDCLIVLTAWLRLTPVLEQLREVCRWNHASPRLSEMPGTSTATYKQGSDNDHSMMLLTHTSVCR